MAIASRVRNDMISGTQVWWIYLSHPSLLSVCFLSIALERKKGLRLFVVRIGVVDDSSLKIVEKNKTKNFLRVMFNPLYLNIN